jgi:glycerophosphoryl diester phosphodiesterase
MTIPDFQFLPPVIAHRGAGCDAPENTLAAFRAVPALGASWIETDVKLTQDGTPILFHDDTLDRTTNGKGNVADMVWADLQKLDAGSWFSPSFADQRVPLLAEAVRYFLDNNLRLNLELKPCPGRTRATVMVALIEMAKLWPHDHASPLISSFDIEALAIAAQLHPDWPRGLLLDKWREDWGGLMRKVTARSLHMKEDQLTQDRVQQLVSAEVPVLAYTVNDPARAKELLHWGVAAVFTDKPGDLIRAL